MSSTRLSLAAAVLSLAAACHSPAEPAPPADIFQLTTIDGRPLPTTRTNDPSSNGATILREELILDQRGIATRNTTLQGAAPSATQITTISYAYTRVGDVVTLGNVLCGPGALCIQHFPEQGPIDHNEVLTLTPAPGVPVPGSVLVYRRWLVALD
jgi:hypothetical protein